MGHGREEDFLKPENKQGGGRDSEQYEQSTEGWKQRLVMAAGSLATQECEAHKRVIKIDIFYGGVTKPGTLWSNLHELS